LKEQAAAGKPMNYKAMHKGHPGVLCAIKAVFGGYAEALKAAGFDLSTFRRRGAMMSVYPTGESIVDAIRQRRLSGKKLNAASVAHETDGDVALHSRAVRVFGSWGKALVEAGVDPKEVSEGKYRTPDSVLEGIHKRVRAGIQPEAKFVLKGEHADSSLYGGALRHFGGWIKALKAAGINYRPLRRRAAYQTRDELLSAIRERHANGLPLEGVSVRSGEHVDWSLYGAAERLFGNWAEAVHVALPDAPLLRRWREKAGAPKATPVPPAQPREQPGIPPAVKPKPPHPANSKPGDAPTTMEDLIRNMGLGD
jgi:hypothetical protein